MGIYHLRQMNFGHDTGFPNRVPFPSITTPLSSTPRPTSPLLDKKLRVLHLISVISPLTDTPQFVSNIFLFLVAKQSTGDLYTIITLRELNAYVHYLHFKMEGIHLLWDLMQPGDWFTHLDLKVTYLTVPINLDSQRCL